MGDMTPTDKLRALLDERGIKWWYGIGEKSTVFDGEYGVRYEVDGTLGLLFIRSALDVTPEQAIAATVGAEPWEPSKEWKAWHESLKHDNPTNVREVVESILFDAIEFGGDMGPNGNVCSGVDEGDVLTDGCINGWVKSIEEIAATVGAGYAITFAPTLDRPLETMVGETVFDSEGNAVGWIVNATVGVGTCEVEYCADFMGWHCKSCDTLWMGLRDQKPSYCMRCGAKVVSE